MVGEEHINGIARQQRDIKFRNTYIGVLLIDEFGSDIETLGVLGSQYVLLATLG